MESARAGRRRRRRRPWRQRPLSGIAGIALLHGACCVMHARNIQLARRYKPKGPDRAMVILNRALAHKHVLRCAVLLVNKTTDSYSIHIATSILTTIGMR